MKVGYVIERLWVDLAVGESLDLAGFFPSLVTIATKKVIPVFVLLFTYGSTVRSPWFLWSRMTTTSWRARSWAGWDAASASTALAILFRYDCLELPVQVIRRFLGFPDSCSLAKPPVQ